MEPKTPKPRTFYTDSLKCYYCGRFVRYEGVYDGSVGSIAVWDQFPEASVDHIRYWHTKCRTDAVPESVKADDGK